MDDSKMDEAVAALLHLGIFSSSLPGSAQTAVQAAHVRGSRPHPVSTCAAPRSIFAAALRCSADMTCTQVFIVTLIREPERLHDGLRVDLPGQRQRCSGCVEAECDVCR